MKSKLTTLAIALLSCTLIFSACSGGSKTTSSDEGSAGSESKTRITEVIKAEKPDSVPAAAKNRKDTFIIGTTAPKGKFCPIYADSTYDQYVNRLVFNGLMLNDEKGNPVGDLAEKWEISQDGKIYTFHLKKGVKFSNGDELTADDVAFTYTSIADPKYDGPRMDAVEKIVGYKEYNKGDSKEFSGIKVVDPNTITFTYSQPKANAITSDFTYGIMSKKYYGFEKGGIKKLKDLFQKPIGSGPYTLTGYKAGQEVDFEKNTKYFKGEPKIKNIIMKVTTAETNIQELSAGGTDMDLITANPENIQMIKDAGFLNMQLFPDNGYTYIGMNMRLDMFKDQKVRQALMYSLDRKGFTDAFYKGYGEVINIPQTVVSWAYTTDVNKYDLNLDKANKLLDEAGWVKKDDGFRYKDGKKFTIHLMLSNSNKRFSDIFVPLAKENWNKVGVELIPEIVEFSTMAEKVYDKQEFEMYSMGWSLDIDPDPSGIFAIAQDTLGGSNSVGWRNEEAEKLLVQGSIETDREKRKEIYTKWYKIANEDLPYLFLCQRKDLWAVSSRVKNMNVSPYIEWWVGIEKVELAN
ncbi:ABC transporter substrate-binding protein [Clostridium omnivorum]|uniref:Peptide-binding protein n=1 Tax=Clostridium omnivorum TaxID=1604902 RepID=A0ABQ5N1U6_9CLOT|nr:ABC transporter substrate-binding protein [Clostridium sp. E14]GLC29164.1 peptide-binding protein [Clostridium sp. E14]